jgi:hypothetical protein
MSSRRARASSTTLQPTSQHNQRVFVRRPTGALRRQDQPASAPQGLIAGAEAWRCRPAMGVINKDLHGHRLPTYLEGRGKLFIAGLHRGQHLHEREPCACSLIRVERRLLQLVQQRASSPRDGSREPGLKPFSKHGWGSAVQTHLAALQYAAPRPPIRLWPQRVPDLRRSTGKFSGDKKVRCARIQTLQRPTFVARN